MSSGFVTATVITNTDEDDIIDVESEGEAETLQNQNTSQKLNVINVTNECNASNNVEGNSEEDGLSGWWSSSWPNSSKVSLENPKRTQNTTAALESEKSVENNNNKEKINKENDKLNDDPTSSSNEDVQLHPSFVEPKEECAMLPDDNITPDERETFQDFFSSKSQYSKSRYLLIRNEILKKWNSNKPQHVNKVVMRPILRKKAGGNVNNIGRIHKYLESIGAINFNSDKVWWKLKVRKPRRYSSSSSQIDESNARCSKRSRKVVFLDEPSDQIEYTIDHTNNTITTAHHPPPPPKKQPAIPRVEKYKLIPCRKLMPDEVLFNVVIHVEAMLIIDICSHLAKHEVIGLLGGVVEETIGEKIKTVHIFTACPCKSTSSSRHCDMDPMSQKECSEKIEREGLNVIGWFHSHPTFNPHPSITDINTQLDQQSIFEAHGSMFIGIIISSYNRFRIRSETVAVYITEEKHSHFGYNIPVQLPYEIDFIPRPNFLRSWSDVVMEKVNELVFMFMCKYKSDNCRLSTLLDPIVQGSTITHIGKLMRSLKSLSTSVTKTSKDSTNTKTGVSKSSDEEKLIEEMDEGTGGPSLSADDLVIGQTIECGSENVMTSGMDDISQVLEQPLFAGLAEPYDSRPVNTSGELKSVLQAIYNLLIETHSVVVTKS